MVTQKKSTQLLIAETLVGSISEDTLATVLSKMFTDAKRQGAKDISPKFDFYVSVYYKADLVRSRTLNHKREAICNSSIEQKHKKFFEEHFERLKQDSAVMRYTRKGNEGRHVSLLKIGHFTIIVSDENRIAVHVCGALIAIMLAKQKALSLIKEMGHVHDLQAFFKQDKEESGGYILDYLNQVTKIEQGTIGGHK